MILFLVAMNDQIVKICGLKTLEAAEVVVSNGADLLGTILVPNRERTVDLDTAKAIAALCQRTRIARKREFVDSKDMMRHLRESKLVGIDWFDYVAKVIIENGPFLVGVFRNQSLDEVKAHVEQLGLDIVQLHGSEDLSIFIDALDVPVIPRFVLNKDNIKDSLITHKHLISLLDSEVGGEGKLISWEDANTFGEKGRYILAGGLTPANVNKALLNNGCLGVDVSGGVETNKVKDNEKIVAFIKNAK